MSKSKNPLMDKRIKKVSVFDTETAPYYETVEIYEKSSYNYPKYGVVGEVTEKKGKFYYKTDKAQRELIFDIGWTICNKHGDVYIERNFLVKEVFSDINLMRHAFYFSKYPKYLEMLQDGKVKMKEWAYIIAQWEADILAYGIRDIFAFNIPFDKRAMEETHRILTGRPLLFLQAHELRANCLWGMACETILQKRGFIKLAIEQKWLTKAGRISTNAETCYRYISETWDFEESHTALDDAIVESKILGACFDTRRHMSFGILSHPFRLVHAKAMALGLLEETGEASD